MYAGNVIFLSVFVGQKKKKERKLHGLSYNNSILHNEMKN